MKMKLDFSQMIEGESRNKTLRIMNLYRSIFINISKTEAISTFKEINRKKRICICAVSLLHQHELKKNKIPNSIKRMCSRMTLKQ